MIDRVRRDKLADSIHEFLIGLTTNYEFENARRTIGRPTFAPPRPGDDPILSPMLERCFWYGFCHGDSDEYRLLGEYKLPAAQRAEILRWILFLRSDLEYQWPSFQFWAPSWNDLTYPFLWIGTLGYWGRLKRRRLKVVFEKSKTFANYDVWPFLTQNDFDALRRASCPFATTQ